MWERKRIEEFNKTVSKMNERTEELECKVDCEIQCSRGNFVLLHGINEKNEGNTHCQQ